uniref:Probable ATP-dependent transporter ycf16 n=1 Tax=Sciadococcus taiwanensis TaxID=3028030 RepID=A0A9Y1I225_9RHOD|nr:manganese transport system ATP-binding protein [Sciadococcus taiwanensis]
MSMIHKAHTIQLLIKNLNVYYRQKRILKDINFQVSTGKIIGIIGPNGAGKSTLFKVLLDINHKNSGRIIFNQEALSKYKKEIAYIPQRSQIDWNYPITVWEIVMMGQIASIGWLGNFSNSPNNLINYALSRLGIKHLQNSRIGELSGGQQQRVFLARAIAQQANIFFLDEPFIGLDYKTQEIILNLLRELASKENKLILIINHDLGEIINYFDELLLLNKTILKQDKPKKVLQSKFLTLAYEGELE